MLIDLTLLVTPPMTRDAEGSMTHALFGHLGTHFDIMDQSFPLEYTERAGIVFDVSKITDRDIEISDIDLIIDIFRHVVRNIFDFLFKILRKFIFLFFCLFF